MQAREQRAHRPVPHGARPSGRVAAERARAYDVLRPAPDGLPEPVRSEARDRRARLRSTLGVALLPCAFAVTAAWLVFLGWLAFSLVDLPFR